LPVPAESPSDLWFVFHEGRILVNLSPLSDPIPRAENLAALRSSIKNTVFLGVYGGAGCFAGELASAVTPEFPGKLVDLRDLVIGLDEGLSRICGRASQLLAWEKNNAYCGRCGSATESKSSERAKVCPRCGQYSFPRISPAVIVAVVRDKKILLARNKTFTRPFHSVLAGFVEPGETLEYCVKREVFEETGIRIKNIRYFGSQPWPFPDSLMLAFTAEYASGEIKIDGVEIGEADWYGADSLPAVPPHGSISRKLIDWFRETASE